jgi:glutamyl-tRNA synthetase
MLHVGALRTVFFDYLFARRHGGQNILRIEDTDRSRYSPDSEREFIETLHWVGIDFDEGPHVGGPHGPYRQSERKEAGIYSVLIQQLIAKGYAYFAFETPQELEEMREFQRINKQPEGYFGGDWRDASEETVLKAKAEGKPFVIRQRIPRGKRIEVQDAIRGRIDFESDTLPDPVLIKADGMPTYHFAAIADDHLMGITHVFRGEEWISTFPYHWTLIEQFGWTPPVFVHCPVIVGDDGKKLSKRHGATRVMDYMAEGYLKDSLKNFVALIGWSPRDERELMSMTELIHAFDIEGIQPSPGKFDLKKLRWLNGHRIRQMDPAELLDMLLAYINDPYTQKYWQEYVEEPTPNRPAKEGQQVLSQLSLIAQSASKDQAYVLAALKEEQERVETLADFGEAMHFFLVEEPPMDAKAVDKWFAQPHVEELFDWILQKLGESRIETVEHYRSILEGFQQHKGMEKLGPIVHPTRVALTGKTVGPGLFELMAVLGHDRVERRIRRAKNRISS